MLRHNRNILDTYDAIIYQVPIINNVRIFWLEIGREEEKTKWKEINGRYLECIALDQNGIKEFCKYKEKKNIQILSVKWRKNKQKMPLRVSMFNILKTGIPCTLY